MSFMDRYVGVKKESFYYSVGLKSFLVSVYNYMALALALTGIVAYGVSSSNTLMYVIYGTPLSWVVALAPIGFVFFVSSRIHTMSLGAAQFSLGAFAVIMGLSLSFIFVVYTSTSIARVFFISASMFGLMALYGNTTKKDLSSMASFLYMGVIGLIIASLVNMFMQSSVLHFAVSAVGVLVFAGLTAYDMQKIKDDYYRICVNNDLDSSSPDAGKLAISGALTLYLDFINIFINLLHIIGDRK